MSGTAFMRDPPEGEDRWAAASFAPTQQVVGAALFALASVVYGLRVFTRLCLIQTNLRLDDYLSGASMIACWVFYGCTMGMIEYGGCGRDLWQVTQPEYEALLRWTIPVSIFYLLSSDFAKLSLLALYHDLTPDRSFRVAVRVTAAAFALYAVAYALTSIFSCHPAYASWDLAAMATATCIDKEKFFLAASVANVCMDVIILLAPLRIVVPLQMPKRQKASLLFLFATGGFVIFLAVYNGILTIQLFSSDNYTSGLANELTWMYGELAGCVVCASASSLRPFFVRYAPAYLRSLVGGAGSGAGSAAGGPTGSGQGQGKGRLSRRGTGKVGRGAPDDAYELSSQDGSESGGKQRRGVEDGEEAQLWPCTKTSNIVSVSAERDVSRGLPGTGPHGAWANDGAGNVINVVHTADVSYSRPR